MSGMVRNIFGQERSAFDPRFMMDNRRILIANLSKGRIGDDKANLIGSLLVSAFALAAASRVDLPEPERADFYLFADEFQNFATDSFASILSEARKYRLSLALFHQFEDQLALPIRRAIFGNVGTLLAFRIGQHDALEVAPELQNALTAEELTDLDRFEIAVRLLENGAQRAPFRARTIKPSAFRYGRRETIIEQSRMRFGRPREKVERGIARIMPPASSPHPSPSATKPRKDHPRGLPKGWR